MCLIAVCEKRNLSEEEFFNAWFLNSDGMGMAWPAGGSVFMRKGFMDRDNAYTAYLRGPVYRIFPHILHFRARTVGEAVPELTHPFLCVKGSPPVLEYKGPGPLLFHNGTALDWREGLSDILDIEEVKVEGPVNDSRLAAMWVARAGAGFLENLDGRFALLSPDGYTLFGGFRQDNGILFSNSGYK